MRMSISRQSCIDQQQFFKSSFAIEVGVCGVSDTVLLSLHHLIDGGSAGALPRSDLMHTKDDIIAAEHLRAAIMIGRALVVMAR